MCRLPEKGRKEIEVFELHKYLGRGFARIKLVFDCVGVTSTLVDHFVSSPREREKRDRRDSRGDEREGWGRKRDKNENEKKKKK